MNVLNLLVLPLALVPAVPAQAPTRGDPVDAVLLSAATPDILQARLLAFAAQAASGAASRAAYFRGLSFERAARPDSAIACYRRSAAGGDAAALTALVDALLRRRAEGDVAEATAALEKLQTSDEGAGERSRHPDPARLGWAYVLSGQAKQGLELLKPLESRLTEDLAWCYRFGRAYLDAGDPRRALGYLTVLNTAARGQDREISSLLERVTARTGSSGQIQEIAKRQLEQHDEAETPLLRRLGGRRVRLLASDGAFVGGAVFADSTAKRPARAALVLAGLGDELRDVDSLTAALRAGGFAVFLLDPRGSGWSVAPEFSLPDTWEGRQDALAGRVARDLHDALHAFPRIARVDTMRVLLVGIGAMAPIVVAAAAEEPHIAALALLDPWTSPVDRGATLAAAARVRAPAYLHVGVPGRGEATFVDLLFHRLPEGKSRLVESTAMDGGAAAFGSRPDVTPRFVRWLDETFSAGSGRRAPPRATPPSR